MQCKALCYLGKYTLPIHFAEKVICKSMSMNSDRYMNSEMEETTMNSAWEGLGLASTKEWMGFSTWQGEQASRGEEHAVAESPEPRSHMKVRRQKMGTDAEGLPIFSLCFKGGGEYTFEGRSVHCFWKVILVTYL